MRYELFFEEAALKELARIDKPYRIRIKEKIVQLAENYESLENRIKKLKGNEYKGFERLRVGDYRVVYKREERRLIITVVRVGHRKAVY